MTRDPLFPELAEQLRALADDPTTSPRAATATTAAAPEPEAEPHGAAAADPGGRRRPRRPGWRTGTLAIAGILALSSGAYAARGLWQPELGTENGRPQAIEGPPSADLLSNFAVLRRAQTDADRGADSLDALRFTDAPTTGVRTGSVRRIEPKGGTSALVLVPLQLEDGTERLCLWVGPRDAKAGRGGSRGCATPRKVLQQSLAFGVGEEPGEADRTILAPLRRQIAALSERPGRPDSGPRREADRARLEGLQAELREATKRVLADHTLQVSGVAPDGVTQVRVGRPGRITAVEGNAWSITMPERELGTFDVRWLDDAGREIPPERFGVPDPSLSGPPAPLEGKVAEELAVRLATSVDPAFASRLDAYSGKLFDACLQLRHDPPLSAAHQVDHVQRQFARKTDLKDFTDADAAMLLEVLRATWCPIA